ncbi:hypothetical protein Z043_115720 [Scleropages formosus]|uniref:Uncharacterized protein n=1 Tax=Scleropages formosus TaxID=113540 RepID=A0A0P7WVY4_SCLFO|nr:hypothetical protein Z043_115720 [Scleropages formosus]
MESKEGGREGGEGWGGDHFMSPVSVSTDKMKKGALNFLSRKNQSLFDPKLEIKELENADFVWDSLAIPESGTANVRFRPTVKHNSSSSDVLQGFAVPTPKAPLLPSINGLHTPERVNGDQNSRSGPLAIRHSVEGEIFIPPPPSMAPPPPPQFIPPPPESTGSSPSPLALLQAAKEREKQKRTMSEENYTKTNSSSELPTMRIYSAESRPNSIMKKMLEMDQKHLLPQVDSTSDDWGTPFSDEESGDVFPKKKQLSQSQSLDLGKLESKEAKRVQASSVKPIARCFSIHAGALGDTFQGFSFVMAAAQLIQQTPRRHSDRLLQPPADKERCSSPAPTAERNSRQFRTRNKKPTHFYRNARLDLHSSKTAHVAAAGGAAAETRRSVRDQPWWSGRPPQPQRAAARPRMETPPPPSGHRTRITPGHFVFEPSCFDPHGRDAAREAPFSE